MICNVLVIGLTAIEAGEEGLRTDYFYKVEAGEDALRTDYFY